MKHKGFAIAAVSALLLLEAAFAGGLEDPSWNIKKSEHFIIYYHEAPAEYIEDVINAAEKYYNSITAELGFTRFDSFWTWDKRAKIYLYKDAKEYRDMSKQPGWSGAGVNIYSREIKTFVNMRHFFDTILPHELGHIIFREFVGFDKSLPLWMDEGVVSYLEKDYRGSRSAMVRSIVDSKYFMPLEELDRIRSLNKFISPDIFYAESASVIEFLMTVYGQEKFINFCRHLRGLRSHDTWDKAAEEVYGFRDISEMNQKWMEFLNR